jgi:hypothetical protein
MKKSSARAASTRPISASPVENLGAWTVAVRQDARGLFITLPRSIVRSFRLCKGDMVRWRKIRGMQEYRLTFWRGSRQLVAST